MKITISQGSALSAPVDLLAMGVPSGKSAFKKALGPLSKAFGPGVLATLAADERFEGKPGQVMKVATRGRIKARWLVLVGLGDKGDPARNGYIIGQAAARAAKGQSSAGVIAPQTTIEVVRGLAEGLVCGAYRYTVYKTEKDAKRGGLRSATLLTDGAEKGLTAAVRAGKAVGESVCFARDLVNEPPNDLNPVSLARIASREAKKLGLTTRIWDKRRIAEAGMELFLAVNKGSAIEPRLIHVAYKPRVKKKKVAFVGKGLTFDSGGLCIKPAGSMLDMKCDMAGAATTLGIVFAAARLKLPIEVHAIVGSTENMTGAKAYRPGDVYKSLQGKTVEIINTDAEGRLVLADVLTWASRLKPDYLIDHATLTGACMVALGPWTAGLYTDDDKLAGHYLDAGKDNGESYWRMPLNADLKQQLKSQVADIKHCGTRYGGSITAALFLKEFVGKTPWMHLDIAGPAFVDSAHKRLPKGGTGFGIATGVSFLERLARGGKGTSR